MRAAMLRAGRRPTNLANIVNSVNLVLLDYWAGLRLLEVRTVTFSSDSSRKWQSLWLGGENLDRSWRGALLCWRMLGSVSEHHSLEWGTIPHCRFTRFVEIWETQRKCYQICDPTNGLFSAVLMTRDESRPTCCRSFLCTMEWIL